MIARWIHRLGFQLERLSWDTSDRPLRYPPVFIIGPPRCGSTLLYQCLVNRFRLGYISNLHHRFYLCPALIERMFLVSRWPRKSTYESRHGNTEGWTAPSESWNYWYRFFRRRPQYVGIGDAPASTLRELRGSMRAMGNACGRPILVKNLPCSLRIEPLFCALPEASFVVVHRDRVATARSILAGRKQALGNYETWWSVEPPQFEELLGLPPHEQALEQIIRIYRTIDQGRRRTSADAFLDVTFEDFCADVHTTVARIADFLHNRGIRVDLRGDVPATFAQKHPPAIPASMLEKLQEYSKLQDAGHRRPST